MEHAFPPWKWCELRLAARPVWGVWLAAGVFGGPNLGPFWKSLQSQVVERPDRLPPGSPLNPRHANRLRRHLSILSGLGSRHGSRSRAVAVPETPTRGAKIGVPRVTAGEWWDKPDRCQVPIQWRTKALRSGLLNRFLTPLAN